MGNKRSKRSGDDYEEDGSGSDGAQPSKTKKKARSSSSGDEVVLFVCEITKNRRVTVKIWKGVLGVDIREYYEKRGEMIPGKRGILLQLDQWKILGERMEKIIEEIKKAVADSTKEPGFEFLPSLSFPAAASSLPEGVAFLKRYTDKAEGFTLLRPSSWIKVEKAGATALFEQEGKGINNIGIVVSPVRLDSLRDFGTPQLVADKLIQAERRKESTKEAEVITASERLGHGGLPVYEFEYTVDSTRGGVKRIFSAAFVASEKLYLLNIQHSDRPENPLDSETRTVLEQILHSFDVAS